MGKQVENVEVVLSAMKKKQGNRRGRATRVGQQCLREQITLKVRSQTRVGSETEWRVG